jgi:hypothetical protein
MDEKYVLAAAQAIGLPVPESKVRAVTENLQRIQAIAQALEAIELDPLTDEPAPVWRP